jgi:hypothetical protein
MPKCYDHAICGLDDAADPDAGFCILHSKNPAKDAHAFAEALAAHREKHGETFTRMVFPRAADFTGVTFATPAFFHGALFLGAANFTGATFRDSAFFHGATFSAQADFTWASFEEGATFARGLFTQSATFTEATFTRGATFSGTGFMREGTFHDTTFLGAVDVSGARFEGAASFNRASFHQAATFDLALFRGPVAFCRTRFLRAASFASAQFQAGADFQETEFAGQQAGFGECVFGGQTRFAGRREGARIEMIFSDAEVDFRNVRADPPGTLWFFEADLRKCRLLDSDLRRFRLTRVIWPAVVSRWEVRAAVYDEIVRLQAGETRPWARIQRLYYDLKRRCEVEGEYERAGEFHCGEREMQRKNPATPPGLRSLLTLSWAIWGHGERFLRPWLWAALLLLLSTLAYFALGLVTRDGGRALTAERPLDWLQASHYALQTMTLVGSEELVPLGAAKGIQTAERSLGPLLIGLGLLAIRRRLRW